MERRAISDHHYDEIAEYQRSSHTRGGFRGRVPKSTRVLRRVQKGAHATEGLATAALAQAGISILSLANARDYNFQTWKVVWTRVGHIESAVVGNRGEKAVIPQETLTLVACESAQGAHFIAALINGSVFQYAVSSFSLICHTGSMQCNCGWLMRNGDCGNPAGKKTAFPRWFDHHLKIVSPGGNGAEGSIVSCPAAPVATRTAMRPTAHQGYHSLAIPERRPECSTSVSTGLLKAIPSRC